MNFQIDIAHPAHIHYFRNFANKLEDNGHKVLFTLRDRGIILSLADFYNINYVIRSRERKNKILYAIISIYNILKTSIKFKPDIFIDMGTVFASPVAAILRKPYIALEDTERAHKARDLYFPFASVILTPEVFELNLGKKQLRFNGTMEMMYLLSSYFKPMLDIKHLLNLDNNERYVILRFVAWQAHHDVGLSGLSFENKLLAVKEFSKYAKVFISSEGPLESELLPYKLPIPSERIHDALYHATLYFGEGATMASESAVLGTPSIYINEIWAGTINNAEKYGLIYKYKCTIEDQKLAILKGIELLKNMNLSQLMILNHKQFLSDKIDVTSFLVWFVENWPDSMKIMKENPDYTLRFR